MSPTRLLACFGASCVGGLAQPQPALSQATRETQALVEVRTIRVSDRLQPLGVAASPDGQIVVWTRDELFLVTREGSFTPILGPPIHQALAGGYGDNRWELVDVGRRAILRFNSIATEPSVIPFVVSGDVYSASRVSCGWLFQVWNSRTHKASLVLVDAVGKVSWSIEASWARKLPRSIGQVFHLAGAGDEATVTALGAPFETATVNCSGDVEMLDHGPPMPEGGRWIALATIPISTGFLTTYSDITSNRRVIRWRDMRGAFINDSRLNVPLGIAASVDSTHVVAVRRTDYMELVVYAVERSSGP